MIYIDDTLEQIKAMQGQLFTQVKGQKFTYEVNGDVLSTSTTNQNLPKHSLKRHSAFIHFRDLDRYSIFAIHLIFMRSLWIKGLLSNKLNSN